MQVFSGGASVGEVYVGARLVVMPPFYRCYTALFSTLHAHTILHTRWAVDGMTVGRCDDVGMLAWCFSGVASFASGTCGETAGD